ncbi:MAG: prolipoprotein diacylglyceryl transferase [Anaerolineae bacterium]|nr:prolipoprotein diacylglyceryl transferase [Thermoflexales bacterium]MDW8406573.1 prolipoprotein diacylglyceryl transferase [Anaerolineae bacterium]
MAPIIQVFGFSVQAGPLAALIGFVAGLSFAARLARWRDVDGAAIHDAGFYGALAGLLAARFGYVVAHWSAYASEPLSALMPSLTALWPWTGWPVGLAVAGWMLWRKGMARAEVLDVLAPGVLLGAIGMAAADFLNGDSLGLPTTLPWGVALWGVVRHPVPLYEIAALVIIAGSAVVSVRRPLPAGAVALGALAAYAMARVAVDGFRADGALLAGLRVSQLAGVGVSAVALWLLSEVLATSVPAHRNPTHFIEAESHADNSQ